MNAKPQDSRCVSINLEISGIEIVKISLMETFQFWKNYHILQKVHIMLRYFFFTLVCDDILGNLKGAYFTKP